MCRNIVPYSPIWSCFRRGLPSHNRYRLSGVLLPHHFTLTRPSLQSALRDFTKNEADCCTGWSGGLLSVALSMNSRPPGITWRLAQKARTFLFPVPCAHKRGSDCLANSRFDYNISPTSLPKGFPVPTHIAGCAQDRRVWRRFPRRLY